MKRCIVIGSMPVEIPLKKLIKAGDFIFCADGGYLEAKKQGITPNMIVGDFDSSEKPTDTQAFVLALPAEKDDTDTYYIARHIVENNFTDALFCGVTGGRLEHTIANLQMLKFLAANRVNATIMDKTSQIMVLTDGKILLPPMENKYFSIFSMNEKAEGVSEKGAKYQLDGVEVTNEYPIGISNEFVGKEVEIQVEKGSLLLIITDK
ncbi:MAG: thiamine diphosphokinase [Oscillospiraceae bacterium]